MIRKKRIGSLHTTSCATQQEWPKAVGIHASRASVPNPQPGSRGTVSLRNVWYSAGMLMGFAVACSAGPEGELAWEEAVDEKTQAAVAFAIQTVELDGVCKAVHVSYTAAPAVAGKTLVRYELERARNVGGTLTPMARIASAGSSSFGIADGHYVQGEKYSYRVVPVYRANGVESKGTATTPSSFTASCVPPRATSGITQSIDVYLYTPTDSTPPAFLTKQYVENLVFSEQNSGSLFNFMQDVSAGYGHTALIPQIRIGGRVSDWKKLSKPRSGYPNGLNDMMAELGPTAEAFHNANPTKRYVFILNTGQGGGDGGSYAMYVGAELLNRPLGTGIGALAHELGHSLGLKHELAVRCPNGVFPASLDNIGTSCTVATYTSGQNVMSFASYFPNYFNAVQKKRLGFVSKNQTSWYDIRTLPVGSSATFTLYNSTSTQSDQSKVLLYLKFDDAENAYALQYRRALGFDSLTVMASPEQAGSFPEGVYVYLAPGANVNGIGTAESAMLFRDPVATWSQPLILTSDAATAYYDPTRKIEIKVSNLTTSAASIKVTRR